MDFFLTPNLVPPCSWRPSVECLPKISANAPKSVALATACGEWSTEPSALSSGTVGWRLGPQEWLLATSAAATVPPPVPPPLP